MLSICTTVKNRSRVPVERRVLQLFPNCVESIARACAAVESELIVADWESDDWPLKEWLSDAASPVPARIVTLSGAFSRGRGLNTAAAIARGESLFFLDADVLISKSLLTNGARAIEAGKIYFPILYSFNDPEHRTGYWRVSGFGHCMISTEVFQLSGGWPEYCSWGLEDDDFLAKVKELRPVLRERAEDFYHQWHPENIDFKNRYGVETDIIRKFRARADQRALEGRVVRRLRELMPAAASVILLDEDRTDIKDALDCRVIPFLARNGEYWGPPADDEQAIRELDKMQQTGADFIAFTWIAEWWLGHYRAFAAHLEGTAECLEKSELLTVYKLPNSLTHNVGGQARKTK